MMLAVLPTWMIVSAIAVLSSSAAIQLNKDRLNLFLMGVFRDIGRHKAYKRRYKTNDMALMTILLHQEEDPLLNSIQDDDDSNVPEYTLQELWDYGNGLDDNPLLFSIFGRIYDVSAGEKFYGPGATYGVLVGHDATYALATGCKQCVLDRDKDASSLTEAQLQEAKRWLSFFQLHDKYPYVGRLDSNPVEAQMNEWIDAAIAKKMTEDDLEKMEKGGADDGGGGNDDMHPALNMGEKVVHQMSDDDDQEESNTRSSSSQDSSAEAGTADPVAVA